MIDPDSYGLIEMGFTGAVVLGFAVYQLWSVNRSIKRDREAAEREDSAQGPGHPEG